jgi:hypothetical protein
VVDLVGVVEVDIPNKFFLLWSITDNSEDVKPREKNAFERNKRRDADRQTKVLDNR